MKPSKFDGFFIDELFLLPRLLLCKIHRFREGELLFANTNG